MNRQVGPSILLSLLIVASFSYVLHQPDQNPATALTDRQRAAPRIAKENEIEPSRAGSKVETAAKPIPSGRRNLVSTAKQIVTGAASISSNRIRPIRTIPREFSRIPGESVGFASSTPDPGPSPTRTTTRWRKVR